MKTFTDGKRGILKKEFLALAPLLTWKKYGTLVKHAGRTVTASTVLHDYNETKARKVYETARCVVVEFTAWGRGVWYEGRKP